MNTIAGSFTRVRATLAFTCLCLPALMASASGGQNPAPSENPYPAASHVPDSMRGWQAFQTRVHPESPADEAMGGRTADGTPVNVRNERCFPAETRNVFFEVDRVVNETTGALEPFDYTHDGKVDKKGRDAIRGQNTWMLWGEGNETFWNWLQQKGYGLVDFMVLLDSRERHTRFQRTGMINQPGMKAQADPGRKLLGLYLDEADGEKSLMRQPATDIDARTGKLAAQPTPPSSHMDARRTELFEPGDPQLYREVLARLPKDGIDPTVYGYPSGVVGLRLLPNPDFFGKGAVAEKARALWDEKVVRSKDRFYTDSNVQADPELVRPFRVSMSCGFCHVGPHPLDPPADPEAPEWKNLSSIIGNQYWSPPKLFANLTRSSSLIYQFLASQQPGTVDTSLVSTDHINNANTINAVFDVPARLVRAGHNVPEAQSAANLQLRSLEDPNDSITPRHTPRVLVDGSDSIGVFGALARVYLNIGTHSDEWERCHNPIIGFRPQRPFAIATLKERSVYWRSADSYRIPALASFFTYTSARTGASITAPMKLKYAPGGREIVDAERTEAEKGRAVFIERCAVCHSSKQPDGFEARFSSDWAQQPAPAANTPARLTLPMSFTDWNAFTKSAPYQEYLRRLREQAKAPVGGKDEFLENNFLSTDVRIPVTLVGTNSSRAVATNAMRGQVWDNFSSDDYKSLPAVGSVRFYNPYSGKGTDKWGNNDVYYPPDGGPGYYRPASLISLWATAPYLHNNSVGLYNHDPSVQGRLKAFDDGIDRLFSAAKRATRTSLIGDLRLQHPQLTVGDPGFIYRTTESTHIAFPAKFIRPLLEGILGTTAVSVLTTWLWVVLAGGLLLLAWWGQPRHAGFVLLLVAVIASVIIVVGRFDRINPLLWLIPAVALVAGLLFWLLNPRRAIAQVFFLLLALGSASIGYVVHGFVDGKRGDLSVGPIPQGTPINLIMNMNPEAPVGNLLRSGTALVRGIALSARQGSDADKLRAFESEAGQALLEASKCPDFVLDRGHWFAESLSEQQKGQLKAFLKTL